MRKSPTFLFSLSLPLLCLFVLGAATRVKAQTISPPNTIWNWTNTASSNWETTTNWTEFNLTTGATVTNSFPRGAGDIVNILADLPAAGTTTVTLGSAETVGFLALGDVNGNTGAYTIAGSTLTFDGGGLGRATLQNFVSSAAASWSTISSNITINGILDVNEGSNNQFMTILSGAVSGGEINKIGYGALKITGQYTAGAGQGIIVAMRGAGDAGTTSFTTGVFTSANTQNANLILANGNTLAGTNYAIKTLDGTGTVVDGNASRGGTGSAVIQLGNDNEIQNTLTLTFDGVSGSNPYFKLGGFSVTVAGLLNYDSNGVIENQESEAAGLITQSGTVNLGGSGYYSYNGFIRDKNANGTSTVVLNKTGTGIQALSGGNVIYTGNTTISGGTLRLIQTTAFNSNIIVNPGASLELQATGTWNFGPILNGTTATAGTGHDITGGGNLIISGTSNLSVNVNVNRGVTTGNLTVLNNTTTANTFVFNGGTNGFNNFSFTSPNLPATTSFTTVQFQSTAPAVSGTFSAPGGVNTITMSSTAGILVGMTVKDPSGNSMGTVQTVTSTTVTTSGAAITASGTFNFLGGSQTFAGNFNETGPVAAVDFQTPVSVGGGSINITRAKFTLEPSSNVNSIAGGVLSGTGTITLSGTPLDTIFTINNGSGSQDSPNRVSNTFNWVSNGGLIAYTGNTEQLGTLSLASGDLTITTSAGSSASVALTFTGALPVNATTRLVGSTVTFGSVVGVATNEVLFAGQGTAIPFIGGWAMVASSTAGEFNFAQYVPTPGVGITAATTQLNTFAAGNNVLMTAGASATTVSINSLNIQAPSSTALTLTLTGTLTIASGGLLVDGAAAVAANTFHTISGANGKISPGSTNELIITTASGQNLLIGANTAGNTIIINGAGTSALTKAGPGYLIFGSATLNTYSGNTYVNQGTIQIGVEGAVGAGGSLGITPASLNANSGLGNIILDGGSLSFGNTMTINSTRAITIGAQGGGMAVNTGATGTYNGVINATGVFTYYLNYEGSTTVSSGTLNLGGNNIFTGGLETNNSLLNTGAPSSLSSGTDTSVLNLTGNNTIGRIRLFGSTVNLGVNGATPSTNNIAGDIVINDGILNLAGTNNLTSNSAGTNNTTNTGGPNIYMAGGALVLKSGTALGAATSAAAIGASTPPAGYGNPATGTNPGLTITGTSGTIFLNGNNLMVNILNGTGEFSFDDAPSTSPSTTGLKETLYVNTVASTTFTGLINDEYDPITNTTANTVGLTKMGPGNLTLGVNVDPQLISDYHGATTISGGVLTVSSLFIGGNSSSIGASTSDAANLVISNGAALAFAGTVENFTDRSFTIGSVGSDAASIIADGSTRNAIIHFGNDPGTGTAGTVAYSGGAGARTLTLGGFNQGDNAFNEILADATGGNAGVVSLMKIGNGTWVLNETNTYTGLTQVTAGVLAVAADGALGSATGGTILEGGASTQSLTVGGVLDFRNVNYTTPEPLFMEGGEVIATAGSSNFAGPVNISTLNSTFQINDGVTLNLKGNLSGVGSVQQLGQGTLILSGDNSARTSTLAAWTVQAGELELDYTTKPNVHKLSIGAGAGAALTLGGGRLGGELFVNDGATTFAATTASGITGGTPFSEFVNGLTLGTGENKIFNSATTTYSGNTTVGVTNYTVPTVIMVLGNINAGGTVASGTTLDVGGNFIATTTRGNAGGGNILGAWATINEEDWAINSGISYTGGGSFISGLATRTSSTANPYFNSGPTTPNSSAWAFSGTNNIDSIASVTVTSSSSVISTLRYNDTGKFGLSVTNTLIGVRNTIQSGGILVTPNVGPTDNFLLGSAIQAGTGTINTYPNQDFIIYQNNTQGKFVIGSTIITNNSGGTDGLNKLGAGGLVLTGPNTYNGVTLLTSGNLIFSSFGPAGFAASTGVVSTDTVGFSTVYGATAGLTIGQTVVAGAGFASTNAVKIIEILDAYHYVLGDTVTGAPVNATSANTGTTFTFSASGVIGGTFATTTVAGSNQVTVAGTIGPAAGNDGIVIGQAISGVGIPEGSYVTGILDSTHVLISSPATMSGTNNVTYATNASGVGAAPNGVANLVLNGGVLQYMGQTVNTDRAFTLNFNAQISVSDPNTTLTMNGVIATPGNIGDYQITKSGEGTLRFTDATTSGYGITGYVANQGRIQLVSAFANDRYARNDVATLAVSGGAFEFIGDPIASRSQLLPGQFSVLAGESQVEVTSQLGVTTTLTLQAPSGPLIIDRRSGGTVQFVENPGTLGVANLVINTIPFNTQVPIPWAVYKDASVNTDLGANSQPGFNDLAAIDGQTGNVIAASAINGAYFVASSEAAFATDPNGWSQLPASSPAVSEGSFSFNTGSLAGPMSKDTHLSLMRYFASGDSNVDLGTHTLALDQGTIMVAEAVGAHNKIISNGSLTSGYGDLIIQNYNYSAPFQIKANVVDDTLGSSANGSEGSNVLLTFTPSNFQVGEAVSGTYEDSPGHFVTVVPAGTTIIGINGFNLLLSHPVDFGPTDPTGQVNFNLLYNQKVAFVQAGQSVTKTINQTVLSTTSDLASSSTTAGSANILTLAAGSDTSLLQVGMVISGLGIPVGTTITAINGLSITMSANATAANPNLGVTFFLFGNTSSTLAGVGTTILSGTNTYSGSTYIEGGVLRLDSAQAIPGGIGTTAIVGTTPSHIILDGGQIGLDPNSGSFLRGLGTGTSQLEFAGSGGFAAYGSPGTPLIVNLGGAAAQVRWGYNSFLSDDSILILGAPDADSTINLVNPIDLGVLNRVVRTDNGTAAVDGILSGALTGNEGSLTKTGYGTLSLTGVNTYTGGTVVGAGNLLAPTPATAFGSGNIGLGTTTDSDIDDNVSLTLGTGTAPNSVTVGGVNSTGVTSINANTASAAAIGGAVALERNVFLNAPTGASLALSGVVSGAGGITVIGGGDVFIGNATTANSYGTTGSTPVGPGAAITGGTIIRSGTLHVVNNAAALGATTVELGDIIKVLAPVDRATNSASLTMGGGTFDNTQGGGGFGVSNVSGTFVNVSSTVDGHTYTTADADSGTGIHDGKRILVKDDAGNPERNGIYEIVSVNLDPITHLPTGTMELARVQDFSTAANMTYGSEVTVTNGTFAGQTYFMAAGSVTSPNTPDADPTAWLLDSSANPNVALVTDTASLTIANKVDVNATNGTGTTTIGGSSLLTTGSSTFSGNITLQDVSGLSGVTKTLLLSSFTSTADGVIFTGIISEANNADDTLAIQTAGPVSATVGVVSLRGLNTYHGTTTVVANTILRAELGTTGSNSALGFGDNTSTTGTLVQTGGELQMSGNIGITTEALTINGTGTTATAGALHNTSGNNTWGGTVTVGTTGAMIAADTGTTLTLNNATNAVNLNGLGVNFGGTGTTLVSGVISGLSGGVTGAGTVTKSNTGTLTLQAANNYTGITTINGGIVQAENNSALGTTAAGTTVNSGGELDLVGGASGGATAVTIGAEALTLNGTGAGGAALFSVSTAANVTNTYEGTITVGASGATVGAGSNATSAATLALGDGTSHPAIVGTGTLTTVGTTTGSNVGTTLIVDPINNGAGGLTVSSGLTVLNNATATPSTYSGVTLVNGGTLQVGIAGIGSTGTGSGTPGAVNVNSGGTLAGTGTVNGAATVVSGGKLTPGDNGGSSIGTLTFHTNLILSGGSTTTIQINNTSTSQATLTNDKVAVTGNLTLNSGGSIVVQDLGGFASNAQAGQFFDLFSWATLTNNSFSTGAVRTGGVGGDLTLPNLNGGLEYSFTNFFSSKAGQIDIISGVPEPSRVFLMMSGLAFMVMRRRRRVA